MDTGMYTVGFNTSTNMYEISQSGEIIASRVTEGATRAELIDRGMTREDAVKMIIAAAQDAGIPV